jgi:hypothetical protein
MSVAERPKHFWVAGLVAIAAWSIAGGQEEEGSFERTLTIEGAVVLEVRTGSGSIDIRPGGAGRVAIDGRIHVSARRGATAAEIEELVREIEANPPIEVSGNRVVVGRMPDGDRDEYRHVSISYEIEVPRETEVISRTGSGSLELTGVSGPVEAQTGSGSITLIDIGGRVSAQTGSGSIRAERVAGGFRAQTGSGTISLVQTAAGDVEVTTGSGNSELRGVSGQVRARAGSGGISVEGEPNGRWDLETGSGRISLDLPDDASFELDAHTGSGGIDSDQPVAVQGSIREGRLSGRVRNGGPLVRLHTGSGGIDIH